MSGNDSKNDNVTGDRTRKDEQEYYFEGYFDPAYSMPADADNEHAYQLNGSSPPAFPPLRQVGKRRRLHLKAFCLVFVSILLLLVFYWITMLALQYELQVTREGGSLVFTLSERQPKHEYSNDIRMPAETNGTSGDSVFTPDMGNQLDGRKLNVVPQPEDGSLMLSYQQIYKQCVHSVVRILASGSGFSRSGSGIIMDGAGYIITNYHVVADAETLTVTITSDGASAEHAALLIGYDQPSDMAVLKIDANGLPAAEFGDSGMVEAGDNILVIGNSVSKTVAITDGIISAINNNIRYNGYQMTLFQTNALISDASSGGALVNRYGQVVGIICAIAEDSGFAIPINTAKSVVDSLLVYGYVPGRPSLGIELQNVPATYAVYYDLPTGGVIAAAIWRKSDAYTAGMTPGDYIVEIDGVALSGPESFNNIINTHKVGDVVNLVFYRGGELMSVDVKVMDASEFK